ncbi:MAG TPA: cytochrome c maturation protein CcmE [Chloroflexota bacterium]
MSTLTNDPAAIPVHTPSVRPARANGRRKPRAKARFLIAALIIVAAVGYMIYAAVQSGSEYYVTTTEVAAMGDKAVGQQMKLGGRVVDGSVTAARGSNTVSFSITDGAKELPVVYTGAIPDAFQPGADVIVEGKLGTDGSFQANTMLAKCASKYQPK